MLGWYQGTVHNRMYISMEYYPHGNLRDWHHDTPPQDLGFRVFRGAHQVLGAFWHLRPRASPTVISSTLSRVANDKEMERFKPIII